MLKHQSPTAVLLRTPVTQIIIFNQDISELYGVWENMKICLRLTSPRNEYNTTGANLFKCLTTKMLRWQLAPDVSNRTKSFYIDKTTTKVLAFQGLDPCFHCMRNKRPNDTSWSFVYLQVSDSWRPFWVRQFVTLGQLYNRIWLFLKIFWLRENSHTSYDAGYLIDWTILTLENW